MKNNQKGITLIALCVMIIIILIIASVTTYTGINSLQEAKEERLTNELKMVQHAVLETYTKYKTIKNEEYLVGSPIASVSDIPKEYQERLNHKETAFLGAAIKEEKYYLLDVEAMEKLGITNAHFKYIVNYNSGEVMNADVTKTASGKVLYITFE